MKDYIPAEEYFETPWQITDTDFDKAYADPTGAGAPLGVFGISVASKTVRGVDLKVEFEWYLPLPPRPLTRYDEDFTVSDLEEVKVVSSQPDILVLDESDTTTFLAGKPLPADYSFSAFMKEPDAVDEILNNIDLNDLLVSY